MGYDDDAKTVWSRIGHQDGLDHHVCQGRKYFHRLPLHAHEYEVGDLVYTIDHQSIFVDGHVKNSGNFSGFFTRSMPVGYN